MSSKPSPPCLSLPPRATFQVRAPLGGKRGLQTINLRPLSGPAVYSAKSLWVNLCFGSLSGLPWKGILGFRVLFQEGNLLGVFSKCL